MNIATSLQEIHFCSITEFTVRTALLNLPESAAILAQITIADKIMCGFRFFTSYLDVGPKYLNDVVNLKSPFSECEKRGI